MTALYIVGSVPTTCTHDSPCRRELLPCAARRHQLGSVRRDRTAHSRSNVDFAVYAGESSAQAISAEDVSRAGTSLDVSAALVDARFRSTPWAAEQQEEEAQRTQARILFVSESNACRSVLGQAILQDLLRRNNLEDTVSCESKATRDYVVGQGIEPVVSEVATELGIALPLDFQSRKCKHEEDIVKFDLILVMDKFTASDFLKEVSVYETINKEGNYTLKVHRLGEFHPQLMQSRAYDGQDIEDPLYGNVGGEAEKEAVTAVANIISDACNNLLIFLQKLLASEPTNRNFKEKLQKAVIQLDSIEWLAPPMLTPRRSLE